MLKVVPYELEEIKKVLKQKAIEYYGLTDAEYEGSNISQLINLLAYTSLINNTNFTFGLNEMFITQAKDRRNVIKHARQMGYNHKRRVSYQYKIKLKVLVSGEVTLPKYSTFKSGTNSYVYFGEADGEGYTDIFGVYSNIKLLVNENNNNLDKDIYNSTELEKNKYIITEEGQVCKILAREVDGDPRFLLEIIDGIEIPVYSQVAQDIYIEDSIILPSTTGYRNLTKIGTIDTFITDFTLNLFKIQITLEDGLNVADIMNIGVDGYIENRFFFSDLRGEIKAHERNYNNANPNGWNGFYASEYIEETNVLHFKIGATTASNLTSGQDFHNPYFDAEGKALSIEEAITTPFKRTRFSLTTENIDIEGNITYDDYNPAKTFSSIIETSLKNEIEIIVKEGVLKRWNDTTDESSEAIASSIASGTIVPEPIYKYPELSFEVNDSMVGAGYLVIKGEDIEHNGIEMFVTRIVNDGIEYDVEWSQRDFLLAEQSAGGEKSFVAMTDVSYEDYINIHTNYAGTGTELSNDMYIKLNILTSNGLKGNTNSFIEPDDERFEAKYYNEETLTPIVLHVEGSDIEEIESIRKTATLFSNTANRAVTKNDYKTICEAQPFVQSAQVWGGEEEVPLDIPGHIFFSIIPESRPTIFDNSFNLIDKDTYNLFFSTYFQITGKDSYNGIINKENKNVLFNILDDYKIITLVLEYTKPIYMDFNVNIKVLKYKFNQTVAETNSEIFSNLHSYFIREIEAFNSSFYKSSASRYIDEKLGDDYGIYLDIGFSVDLYDNLAEPDKGTFINISKQDMVPDINGYVGMGDDWKFIMPLGIPTEGLFFNDVINNSLLSKGSLNFENVTNCNTTDFIKDGDYLYMELSEGSIKSYDANLNLETEPANSNSEVIEISVVYINSKEDYDNNSVNAIRYKVGSYFIYRDKKTIRLEINTHANLHIDTDPSVLVGVLWDIGDDINIGDDYFIGGESYIDNLEEVTMYANLEGGVYSDPIYNVLVAPFPRSYFVDSKKTISINPKDGNINSTKNVFSRLASVNFE